SPDTMTTRSRRSPRRASAAATSSSSMPRVSALSLSGRDRRRCATPSSIVLMTWEGMPPSLCGSDRVEEGLQRRGRVGGGPGRGGDEDGRPVLRPGALGVAARAEVAAGDVPVLRGVLPDPLVGGDLVARAGDRAE